MKTFYLAAKTKEYLKSINYEVENDFEYGEFNQFEGWEIKDIFPGLNINDNQLIEVATSSNLLNEDDVISCAYGDNNIYAISVTDANDCTNVKIIKVFIPYNKV